VSFSQNMRNEQMINAANGINTGIQFGESVAIDGDFALVGESKNQTDSANQNYFNEAGAANFFRKINGVWTPLKKVTSTRRHDAALFGYDVAMSGEYAVIGAYKDNYDQNDTNYTLNAGAAYIYKWDNVRSNWFFYQKIVASDRTTQDEFGRSVSIDGDLIVVGAPRENHDTLGQNNRGDAGSVYIFKRNALSGQWMQTQKITASDRQTSAGFGTQLKLLDRQLIVGTPGYSQFYFLTSIRDAGAAYIFEESNSGRFNEKAKLMAPDTARFQNFGQAVAIDGNFAAIGAQNENYDTTGGNFVVGAGAVYLYRNVGGHNWQFVRKYTDSQRDQYDRYGSSVDMDHGKLVIGAKGEDLNYLNTSLRADAGAAYLFKYNPAINDYVFTEKISATNRQAYDQYGYAIAIRNGALIVGANYAGPGAMTGRGAAYVYESCDTKFDIYRTACDSINFGGSTYYTSGKYYQTVPNSQGCERLLVLHFTINSSSAKRDTIQACNSYYWNETNTNYQSSGIYTKTITNSVGCDSTLYLHLTINQNINYDTLVACDSAQWRGKKFYQSGLYIDTVPKTNQCDSIYYLDLSINQSHFTIDSIVSCDSLRWNNGITYYSSITGVYDTLVSAMGCDSLVELQLNLHSTYFTTDTISQCTRYTWPFNGRSYAQSGIYLDTLQNNYGCDSIAELVLNINKTHSFDTLIACDSLTWRNGDTYYSSVNSIRDTLINLAGCDSIIHLDLTILPSSYTSIVESSCSNYLWAQNGQTYTNSGTYFDTLRTSMNCDSVVALTLSIDTINSSISHNGITLTATQSNASYQWLDCNNNWSTIVGETNQTFVATSNGSYSVELQSNACLDTSACVQVISVNLDKNKVNDQVISIFPNPNTGEFSIRISSNTTIQNQLLILNNVGQTIKQIDLKQEVNRLDVQGLSKGLYMIKYGNYLEKVIVVD